MRRIAGVTVMRPGRGLSLRAKSVLVVVVPGLAVAGAVATVVAVEANALSSERNVERARSVSQAAAVVLQLATDAETGVRGFVATGKPTFLQPESTARRALPGALNRLQSQLDLEGESASAAQVRLLVSRELVELSRLDRLRDLHRTQTPEAVTAAVAGKQTMDALRTQVAAIQSREAAQERAAVRHRDAVFQRAQRLAIAAGSLGLLFGFGASVWLMTGIVRRLRLVQENVRRLAAGDPLIAMRGGSDEVAAMSAALERASLLIADQRRRLELALSIGRINVWEVDASGQMTMQGDRAGDYGVTMEAGLATLPPQDAQAVRDAVAAVRADGAPRNYEVRNASDGRWFSGQVTRSSDTDVIAVSVDVTALREAEQALRDAEARRAAEALADSERRGRNHALMIGSTGEGIVSADTRGVCTSVNPAAARMLGYEVTDLVGAPLHELMHHSRPDGSPLPREDCPISKVASSGEPLRADDDVFWRRDGSRLPVEYTVSPLTEDGFTRGIVVTFVDATTRRDSTEQTERDAAQLRQGIRDRQLRLHYQPKIDLVTGRCESVEALVRWQCGDKLVYPDAFIPLAERSGVITELTSWVINTAAQQAAAWSQDGLDLRVAVNVSAATFANEKVINELVGAADAHGLPISRLEVELTESALVSEPDAVIATLAKLRAMGVTTAIDDFGTGYSSLAYLKHLPVDQLKIDKSFVMNMPNDTRDQALVAAAVHIAHSFGMRTVAEGVENDLVLRMLRRAECDIGQGYHWSRPVAADVLAVSLGQIVGLEPASH